MAEIHRTKGPWRLGEDACGDLLTIWGALDTGLCVTCVFDDRMGSDTPAMKEAKANAALIVRAVNAHDDLVAALSKIMRLGPRPWMAGVGGSAATITWGEWDAVYEAAEAALALAEVEGEGR